MDWCLPIRALAPRPCSLRSALTSSGVASTPYSPMAYTFANHELALKSGGGRQHLDAVHDGRCFVRSLVERGARGGAADGEV